MSVPVSDRLAEQITTALAQLRAARAQGEYERELTWQSMLDRLLDRWVAHHAGHRRTVRVPLL